MVRNPMDRSRDSVTAPTPQSRESGRGARKLAVSPGGTTTRPSGLPRSLAIFATNLTGAIPTETTRSVSCRIRALSRRPTSSGVDARRARIDAVTSMKASSSESGSTSGENSSKMARILRDSAAYFPMSPRRKIASGQRRLASIAGMAE